MNAREIVTIERVKVGNELLGETPRDWEFVRKEWAQLGPIGGREYLRAQQIESTTTHRITTRFFTGADSSMRLTIPSKTLEGVNDRVFNVTRVINVNEENRWLEWMCEEVADAS